MPVGLLLSTQQETLSQRLLQYQWPVLRLVQAELWTGASRVAPAALQHANNKEAQAS